VDENEDFIIVTSLVKGISDFSFDTTLTFRDEFYEIIDRTFNIKFESKLIQINLPESLTGDYLANVVLYHELGHFIDRRYRISELLTTILISSEKRGSIPPDVLIALQKFFPILEKSSISHNVQLLYNHFSEYFCDLFAAQYVAGTLGCYLQYLTTGSKDWQLSHPSTVSRVELADHFLNRKKNVFLEFILGIVFKASKKELRVRYKEFLTEDFENLIPCEINSSDELHFLFVYGWSLWLSDWSKFEEMNKMDYSLTSFQVYEIINNLIEKSIGNYIVKTNWDKCNDVSTI